MATIDVRLKNATFYDVNKMDVVKGEEFSFTLTDPDGKIVDFTSTNDPVLESVKNGLADADVVAKNLGTSRIIFIDTDDVKQKVLTVTVVEKIAEPAVTLGLTAEQPELK